MADLRKCIGSARFGIEPHEAIVEDFPRQPSQKDGLGRMCKTHWNQYTAALARDAKARKAAVDNAHAEIGCLTISARPLPGPRASCQGPTLYGTSDIESGESHAVCSADRRGGVRLISRNGTVR
jgi:hypothetical protein